MTEACTAGGSGGRAGRLRRRLVLLRLPAVQDAIALYGARAVGLAAPLVVLPYLARRLGPEVFGAVIFAQAYALWLGLLVDYGFQLSGTRAVARSRADRARLAALVGDVLAAKLLLAGLAAVVTVAVGAAVTIARAYPHLLWLAWLAAVAQAMSPLWCFQGLETLRVPAVLEALARGATAVLVFVLVSGPGDGWAVLALQAAATGAASVIGWGLLVRQTAVGPLSLSGARSALAMGRSMFVFTAGVSVYTTANSVILGLFAPPAAVAAFGGSERLVRGALSVLSPVSQVLYPRIAALVEQDRARAAAVARMSLWLMGAAGTLLAASLAVFAPAWVRLFFGPGYQDAVPLLRTLAVLVPLVAISNVLGIQWMLPLGMDRSFNAITIGAGLFNIALAPAVILAFGSLGLAWTVVATETLVTLAMWAVLRCTGQGLSTTPREI